MANRDAERKATDTSSSLLARAKSDDPQAWSTLVSLYAPLIYGWCRRWGVEPKAATAIGKSVLEHVFNKLDAIDNDLYQESFRGWLFELTRRQYLVHAQELNAASDPPLNGEEKTALFHDLGLLEQDLNAEQQLLYQRAFKIVQKSFSPQEWNAFVGLYVQQRSAEDIATELEWTVDSVYIAKSKILRRLRLEFDHLLDF